MSAEPVVCVCTTDIEGATELAREMVQLVIERNTNIATLLTALGAIAGDSLFQLERKGVSVTMDTAFVEMRRVAESQLEANRRYAQTLSLGCAGSA